MLDSCLYRWWAVGSRCWFVKLALRTHQHGSGWYLKEHVIEVTTNLRNTLEWIVHSRK